ncbi:hypothetical protein JZO81_18820 [Enterococcus hulanensis]|nr:hypothetical protein [Enterococcus hulanensis]MBO0413112.1 hypothetical protein [Enterococcus hulanensis]
MSGLFILGQSMISYQGIAYDSIVHKKLQQVKKEEQQASTEDRSPDIQYVTYEYKEKKKDFTHVEKNLALLKRQALHNKTGDGRQSELGKIAAELSGAILFGIKQP